MHRRTVAALLAGAALAHWLWVGRPLVGVGVASLVLAGERVSAAGFRLTGQFPWPLTAVGVVVALVTAGYGLAVDVPVGGAIVASLVLLTTWLSGPRPPDWRLGALVAESPSDPATPDE